jgi:agmatine/peptidylarginine deiminase
VLIPALVALLGFDPILAVPADEIPELVPTATVLVSSPVHARTLRGDFEVSERILLVYNALWPRATEIVARQVLESGATVSFARDIDASRGGFARIGQRLDGPGSPRVELLSTVVDTPWARDWGPLQLSQAGAGLWLNADYDDDERARDDDAPLLLGSHYRAPLDDLDWPLDGGAFVSNGAGLCVLTREYVEEQARDEDLVDMLGQLGCRATAVIPTLVHEPTKHADMVVQFVSRERAMIAQVRDPGEGDPSEDELRLSAAEAGLRRAAAVLGITLELVRVPTPPVRAGGRPYSYVNGLHLADRYLMPSYPTLGRAWEEPARAAVQAALGEIPVVPVDASSMIDSGGAIHCTALGLFL